MYNNGYDDDNERGLGKKLALGVGICALAIGTVVVGGIIYKTHKNKKKKRVYVNGKSRDIDCDVLVDDMGNELPGQEFDKHGMCVNEQEVMSRAVQNGLVKQDSNENYQQFPQYVPQQGYYDQYSQLGYYDQYPQQGYYNQSYPQQNYEQPPQNYYNQYPQNYYNQCPQQGYDQYPSQYY